jgi:glycosyltransferase involved in cell wall biosynthesis
VNASLSVLTELYGKSRIFWCATGLGEDGIPHKMEHFGISTVEAMSAGCVPVVIRRGGQPEIVRDNVDGFCWNSVEELRNLTLKLANDDALLVEMSESSVEKSKDFGMDVFERRARETFLMV